ncbi:MAG TPA: ADYC domain-containing protein [Kofleriaceae bacterium]
MKYLLPLLLAAAGCIDTDLSETGQAATGGGGCPEWGCGMNSPNINGVGFFHELNMDGLPNLQGLRITSVTNGGQNYALAVVNGAIVLTRKGVTLRGSALRNTEILVTGPKDKYTIYITSIGETETWAKVGATQKAIETYVFEWVLDGHRVNLCSTPATTTETLGMNAYRTVVFEGERIDATTKTISPALDSRWFNLGCAGGTLAKLDLTGHTEAMRAQGFSTTIPERQAMLKMLSADYCGDGTPLTVGGEPLRWADDHGTMTYTQAPLPPALIQLEARWTAGGAFCLNTPRLVAHPASGWSADRVRDAIAGSCKVPLPRCKQPDAAFADAHLMSANAY